VLIALALLDVSGSGQTPPGWYAKEVDAGFDANRKAYDAVALPPDEPSGDLRQGDVWMEEFEALDFAWLDD
jgi:hypothetical protein